MLDSVSSPIRICICHNAWDCHQTSKNSSWCLISNGKYIRLYSSVLSYTIFIFPLFFYFDYLLDSMMPWHLFHVPHSVTNNLCPSVPCPLSIFHTLSPSFLSSVLCLSHLLLPVSIFWLLAPLFHFYSYLLNIHSLLLAFLFQLCLLNILSLVTLWVIFYILHTTPSLVVYKSFWLVVIFLACNCCSGC